MDCINKSKIKEMKISREISSYKTCGWVVAGTISGIILTIDPNIISGACFGICGFESVVNGSVLLYKSKKLKKLETPNDKVSKKNKI